MRVPDLFVLGAPKCGTTSLYSWLATHPCVFFPADKEHNFFNTDLQRPSRPTAEMYARMFGDVADESVVVGEASTSYLRSQVAVPAILDYSPAARFIVCLRNPVEMHVSLHAEYLRTSRETERDPLAAWRLQEARKRGESIPHACYEPSDLQYGEVRGGRVPLDSFTRFLGDDPLIRQLFVPSVV